jgi:hypothetical protein
VPAGLFEFFEYVHECLESFELHEPMRLGQ